MCVCVLPIGRSWENDHEIDDGHDDHDGVHDDGDDGDDGDNGGSDNHDADGDNEW